VTRIAFDTNIYVYALDRSDRRRHVVAVDLLKQAVAADCILLQQNIAEFLAVNARKSLLPADEALETVTEWMESMVVAPTRPEDLLDAYRLASAEKIQFWDALIVVTARAAGADMLASEDMQDGRLISGLRIANPFLPTGHALLDAALTQA
jgi:predicted nucleic acid-binding protein